MAANVIGSAPVLAVLLTTSPASLDAAPPAGRVQATVSGVVQNLDNKPVANAVVFLQRRIPVEATPANGFARERLDEVRRVTGPDGRFRAVISSGDWTTHAEVPGYFEKLEIVEQSPFGVYRGHPGITLGVGDAKAVTLLLQPVTVLHGRVFDPDGRPLANKIVWRLFGRNFHRWTSPERVVTDARGGYSVYVPWDVPTDAEITGAAPP